MNARPSLPLHRKLLFGALLAVIGTALLLTGLEAALRLADYGYSPRFTRLAEQPNGEAIWRDNRWCTAPYFSPALVRRPVPFRLPAQKAPGTYRIFVLGSSAAMGDPEPSFSISRVLETLLHTAYPDQHFEVVNAAVTAINSHLVRGIAADCASLEPDLFIVYEGHNEVIGPFGPSNVFAPFFSSDAAVRVATWVKGTRIAQLLDSLGRRVRNHGATRAEWGGMQMFLDQKIPADDSRLDAVRARFRANLLAIAAAGSRAGATTLLCTVLTNQRDFTPFLSLHRGDLSPDELRTWQVNFDAAEASARDNNLAGAERHYRAALAIDSGHAELNFRLGRLALQAGRAEDARPLLQRALDLDALRFRTDSSLNELIRRTADSATPRLGLVDIAAHVSARSRDGIPGDELLYEHVHLTLRGAYEVALEIFPRIVADLQQRGLVSGPPPAPLDYNAVRLRLGYTTHEQAMIALELLKRFRTAPFTGQSDHANRVATWERRTQQATTLLTRPDALTALRTIYQQALTLAPDDWVLARNAGAMLVARGMPGEAEPLLERAAAGIDDDVDTWIALGWAQHALGQTDAAEAAFDRARALEPNYPGLPATTSARR